MSAPIEAYHTEEFHTTDTVVVNSYPIAKFTDNVAVLKSRFYLDWLLRIADGTDNEWGFIGGCTVGSDNYNMHTRGVMTFKGENEVYYVDAGLNTLSFIEEPTNNLEGTAIEVFVIPSYYSESDVVRLFWRLAGSTSSFTQITDNSLVSHGIGETFHILTFYADDHSIPTDVNLEVYAEIENYEGVNTTDIEVLSVTSHSVDISINFKSLSTEGVLATGEIEVTMSAEDKAKIGVGGEAVWYVKFDAEIGSFIGQVLDDNDGSLDLDVYSVYNFTVNLSLYEPDVASIGSYYLAITDLPLQINGYNVNWNVINGGRSGTVSFNFDNTFELRKSAYGANTWYMFGYNYGWEDAGYLIPTFEFAMYDGTTFIGSKTMGCYFFDQDYNFPSFGYGDVAEQFTYARSIGDIPPNVNRVVLTSYVSGLPSGYSYSINTTEFTF